MSIQKERRQNSWKESPNKDRSELARRARPCAGGSAAWHRGSRPRAFTATIVSESHATRNFDALPKNWIGCGPPPGIQPLRVSVPRPDVVPTLFHLKPGETPDTRFQRVPLHASSASFRCILVSFGSECRLAARSATFPSYPNPSARRGLPFPLVSWRSAQLRL